MTRRQVPRWSELRPLLRPKPFQLDPTRRRLDAALTIADLRAVARRRTPRSVFDYTDGAADGEVSLGRSRQLFHDLELRPQILQDVSSLDTSTTLLDRPSQQPFAFAPTGFTRLMHHEGERAVVRGAGEDLMARAKAAGFEALMLTVDVPVAGARLRDTRNGFSIPPALTLKTVVDAGIHPAWWVNLLTTEPLGFASLTGWDATVAELIDQLFDPTMTLADLEWLRSCWDGPLIIKGIQTLDDARLVSQAGADAIVLSNHGGRQLDRAPVPLRLLPDVVEAVGDETEVWVDTGVTSGADIVAAAALGARAVLVGRAYLYGLMAGGERGVQRAADILTGEVRRTMALLGARSVADLGTRHVRLP